MRWAGLSRWPCGVSQMTPMAEFADLIASSLRDAGAASPLYLRLKRSIEDAVKSGVIAPGDALPSERDIAARADVSRVTVRKAVGDLVQAGLLVQRHGSGTFVAPRVERVEQSLSRLTSFTEDMARRGMSLQSRWLDHGIHPPSPEEMMVLGLSAREMVARVARLRIADAMPLAIERASVSAELLPDPGAIGDSLYRALEASGHRPVRAVQRISAANLGESEALLLEVPPASASLHIERISYLATGRVVEFTRSIYRADAYDFVAELSLGAPADEAGAGQ
jgi:GntR family transcriptional regulator